MVFNKINRTVLISALLLMSVLVSISMYENEKNSARNHRNQTQNVDLIKFVRPLIGTTGNSWGNGGKTFPGAAFPLGMVAWSPDTESSDYTGGYSYNDKKIRHFSLTHLSGSSLLTAQQIPVMPYVGSMDDSPGVNPSSYYAEFNHDDEIIEAGYYRVHLNTIGVTTELTATQRTGFGRFTFSGDANSLILINKNTTGLMTDNKYGSTNIINANEISGFSEQVINGKERVYFYIVFDQPFITHGTWNEKDIVKNSLSVTGKNSGLYVEFNTKTAPIVLMKVGLSYVSTNNARRNLDIENPGWDFSAVKSKSQSEWNNKLNKIYISGGTQKDKILFYTSLYHVYLHPSTFSDINGEYLGFDNKIYNSGKRHVQYHYFPNWDLYRSQIQLFSILEPSVASDMVQSLVNNTRQGNTGIPVWQAVNNDYHIMRGDSGIPVIASAYAFGARNFDTQHALSAMIEGRQNNRRWGYDEYKKVGYVPAELDMFSASASLEYSTDDFTTALFAKALDKTKLCEEYINLSKNWKGLFNVTTGFIQPRYKTGDWTENFSPNDHAGFQEGTSEIYTWMIPHDIKGLVKLMGGEAIAISRLRVLHQKPDSLVGNQPNHFSPWVYDLIGIPHLTQEIVRRNLNLAFANEPGGLIGNDDAGSTSAWFVFASMGIYPAIPGVGGFTISTPIFKEITMHLENGNNISIISPEASSENIYISKVYLNGRAYSDPWLPWAKIQHGGTLNFELINRPSTWGNSTNYSDHLYTSALHCKNKDVE